MLFRRRDVPQTEARTESVLLTGRAALTATLAAMESALATSLPLDAFLEAGIPAASLHRTDSPRASLGVGTGFAASGLRTAVLGEHADLASGILSSTDEPLGRLPLVGHLFSSPDGAAAGVLTLPGAPGLPVACPGSVQETIDLALVTQRVVELALVPGLVVHDVDRALEAIQPGLPVSGADALRFAGRARDEIASPTAAQEMLFGARRRRVPVWLDQGRPAGLGARPGPGSAEASREAYHRLFLAHVTALIDQTLVEFERAFARSYRRLMRLGETRAEHVLLATGPTAIEAAGVAEALRAKGGKPVSVLYLPFVSPFPADLVAHALHGKRAVTLIDDGPGTEDGWLSARVRTAVGYAVENGRQGQDALPHPDFPAYLSTASVPRIHSAFVGSGAPVERAERLQAAIRNMLPGGAGRSKLVPGFRFDPAQPAPPHEERHRQVLRRAYPELVSEKPAAPECPDSGGVLLAGSRDPLSHSRLGGTLNALLRATGRSVQAISFQSGPLRHVVVSVAERALAPPTPGTVADAILLSADALRQASVWRSVRNGGRLLLCFSEPFEELWPHLPAVLRWEAADRRLRLVQIPVQVEDGRAPDAEEVSVYALGLLVAIAPDLSDSERTAWADGAQGFLGRDRDRREAFTALFQSGFQAAGDATELVPRDDVPTAQETSAPLSVRRLRGGDGSVFDPVRHWDLFGHGSRTGLEAANRPDPYVGSLVSPPLMAAETAPGPSGQPKPRWVQEACTACGLCWGTCPDAAIKVHAPSVAEVLAAGLGTCEDAGLDVFALRRIEKPLATQAHRAVRTDDLGQLRDVRQAVETAYDRLLERMDPSDEEKGKLQSGLEAVLETIGAVPFRRVPSLFDVPERQEKGSGRLFALHVDASACTACGLCVAVCPEDALELGRVDQQAATRRAQNWEVLTERVPLAETADPLFAGESEPAGSFRLFFERSVATSFEGNDRSTPGSGGRIALRGVLAGLASRAAYRRRGLSERANQLTVDLEARAKRTLSEPLQVNDLDAFAARLASIEGRPLDPGTLASLVAGDDRRPAVDRARVESILEAMHRLREIQERDGAGSGGVGVLMGLAVDGPLANLYRFPNNPHPFPWLQLGRGQDVHAALSGALTGELERQIERARLMRKARLLADDTYDPERHDPLLAHLGAVDLEPDEQAGMPVAVLVTDREEEAMAALQGDVPIKVVLLSDSPLQLTESTGGRAALKVPMIALQALLNPDTFVAQSSVSEPAHLVRAAVEAFEAPGAAFLHVLAPEPDRSGLASDAVFRHAQRAVWGRAFPLFVRRPGASDEMSLLLDLSGNPEPEADWPERQALSLPAVDQGGFPVPFTLADWALDEARLRWCFRRLSPSEGGSLVPLGRLLQEPSSSAASCYVTSADRPGSARFEVAPEMVDCTQRIGAVWRLLLELSGARTEPAVLRLRDTLDRLKSEHSESVSAMRSDYERRIAGLETSHADHYFDIVRRKLLALSGFGPGTEAGSRPLRTFSSGANGGEVSE